jgi:ferric-dicitrate binding protein FerR (iron transport regulator)
MVDLYEQLSQLMDGDLSVDDAAALRKRIANDSEVQAAWEGMQQLCEDLNELPEQLPVPPALRATPSRPANRTSLWPLAVAAAALLVAGGLWMRPPPVTELALGYGVQAVNGDAVLHIMGVDVAISGRAAVFVEPSDDLPRVGTAEDPMTALTHIAAVTAGALITVAVYEGTAAITDTDGSTVVVRPDTPMTVQAGHARPSPTAPHPSQPVLQPPQDMSVEALEQRVAELELENEGLAMMATFAQGQLAVVGGEPSEWPLTVPAYQQPERFEAAVLEAIAEIPGASVLDIDCGEYPCIAHIDLDPNEADAVDDLNAYIEPIGASLTSGEDNIGVMALVNKSDGSNGQTTTLSMAVNEGEGDSAAGVRVESRVRQFYQEQHGDGL